MRGPPDPIAGMLEDLPSPRRVIRDTSNFMEIQRGDELLLGDVRYLVTGYESEQGFGLDGEPKHWVKRAIDLNTYSEKIVKLVFFESFTNSIGGIPVVLYRSPQKEAAVLGAVLGHPHFMHGTSIRDSVGNHVRVIDRIRGVSLRRYVLDIRAGYEAYYFEYLPTILDGLLDCFSAMAFLHEEGQVHGDVRWDHILIDARNGLFRWIDFDYTYRIPEHPFGLDLFGVGNVLAAVVGKGPISLHDLKHHKRAGAGKVSLRAEDFSPLDRFRLMNLKKVYPVVSEKLNRVLLHFSEGNSAFYESVTEVTCDLGEALSVMEAP